LLFGSTHEDKVSSAYEKLIDNIYQTRKLLGKQEANCELLGQYSGIAARVVSMFCKSDYSKDIAKVERKSAKIQAGDLGSVNILVLPGHVILRRFSGIAYSGPYKKLLINCLELYGRKYAEYKACGIFAGMLSYIIFGTGMMLALGALLVAAGFLELGFAVMIIGTMIAALLAYSKYDEVRAKTKRRREEIARQFPNVVSKLALLVSSGMIMDRAWQETAASREGELYQEMKTASGELEQNIAPEEVYNAFIKRCNTKETSKLASAILQNLTKGNAEIGSLLREMAREAWQERRHTAKRDAEVANGKLLIPIMLLFVSILIIILVPLAMSMGGAF
ncbi:MAG: type II secretion system F family protein, partial [Oscillospiraceae bacterium]|nr:type II secretion system F family protein [Oscillospiraceae bacterium]